MISSSPSDAVNPLPNSKRTRTLALLLALIGLSLVWWKQGIPIPWPQRIATPRPVRAARPHLPGEQEWIVGQIGRDIADMAGFAKANKGPAALLATLRAIEEKPEHYQLEVTVGPDKLPPMAVALNNYLWDPDNFTAVARQLLGLPDSATPAPRSAADGEMFERLVRPSPDVLMREDKRLSEALTHNPLDPQLHEEAALLVASFALRHAGACFYDVRRELSSVSAHLAIARALDKHASPAGELAEAILSTLSGRQAAALSMLEHLDRNRDTSAGLPLEANTRWSRALTMRNTGDYRKLDQPQQASLLERLEYVRALRSSLGSEAASKYLLDSSAERLAEWSNITLAGGFSVSDGHLWTERALRDEVQETAAQYRAYHSGRLEDVAAALNAPAVLIREDDGQAPRMDVLGWGMWAQLHQRQLCDIIRATWLWLDDSLGVPKEAKEFKAAVTKQFSGLERFPLIPMGSGNDAADVGNEQRLAKLWQEKPELVPFSFVPGDSRLARATGKIKQLPPPFIWFRPMFPFGTLYDVTYRGDQGGLGSSEKKVLEQFKAMAPYNNRVIYWDLLRRSNPASADDWAAGFAALTDYDAWSMQVVANNTLNDPDRYEAILTRLCEINPNQYLQLGQYLSEHDRPEAAVRAYEKAIDLAPDRIYVSNAVGWLVDYYYDHNRKADAYKVAEMAADVYSARGLVTLAKLYERDNRLSEAESYFQKRAKRYADWEDITAFYGRHQNDPKFKDALASITGELFPEGRQPVDELTGTSQPAHGVVLLSTSKITDSLSLKSGDVIVGINGVRITNKAQYHYLMDTAPSTKVDLIVWSGRNYCLATVDLPDRRLGVQIRDFQPPIRR